MYNLAKEINRKSCLTPELRDQFAQMDPHELERLSMGAEPTHLLISPHAFAPWNTLLDGPHDPKTCRDCLRQEAARQEHNQLVAAAKEYVEEKGLIPPLIEAEWYDPEFDGPLAAA